MKKRDIFLYGTLLLAVVLLFPAQQEVYLSIREGMPAIPLAIPEFVVHDSSSSSTQEAAQELRQALQADLKYSRIFEELPKDFYSYIRPLNPENIFFKDWESISAKILFVGEISDGDGNDIVFEGKVYDVKAGREYSEKDTRPIGLSSALPPIKWQTSFCACGGNARFSLPKSFFARTETATGNST